MLYRCVVTVLFRLRLVKRFPQFAPIVFSNQFYHNIVNVDNLYFTAVGDKTVWGANKICPNIFSLAHIQGCNQGAG